MGPGGLTLNSEGHLRLLGSQVLASLSVVVHVSASPPVGVPLGVVEVKGLEGLVEPSVSPSLPRVLPWL